VDQAVTHAAARYKSFYDRKAKPSAFYPNARVFLRVHVPNNKLAPRWEGDWYVLDIVGSQDPVKVLRLKHVVTGEIKISNVDHVRLDPVQPDQLPDGLLQRVNREVPDLPPVPAFNPEAPAPDVLHPRRVPPPSTMADEDEFLYGAPAIPPAPAENVRPSPPVSVPPAVSPRRRRVLRPGPVARPPPTPLAPTPPVRESPGLADFATPTASPVAEDPAATDSPPRPAPSRPSLATPPDQPASPVLSPLPSRPSDEPTPVRSRSSSHLLVTPDEYSSPSAPSRDTLRLVDEPPSGRSRSPSSLSPRPAQPSMASSSPSRPSPSSDEPTP
ncbi:hypothetical protein FOZ62_012067, partial [Perkinsus olseni]